MNYTTPTAHARQTVASNVDVFGKLGRASLYTATAYTLGLLTFLWAEVKSVESIVWTGLAVALMIAAAILNRVDRQDDRRITIAVAVFIALYVFGMLFNFLFFSQPHEERVSALTQYLMFLFMACVFYAFGAVSSGRQAWPGFAAALVFVAIYCVQHRLDFSLNELYQRYERDQVNIGYQHLGDSLAMVAMVLIARFRTLPVAYSLSAISIVLLFIIPSRSAAVFGSIGLLVACMLVSSMRLKVVLVVAAILAAILARVWISYTLSEQFEGTRHETLFTDQEDSSNKERMEILEGGLQSILSNPIFGNVGFELDVFNNRGFYIHNMLDVWAQAGIIPFLALIVLFVLIGRQWYFMFLTHREHAYRTLPMLVFALLSWMIARNLVYPYLYFVLGYFSATLASTAGSADTADRPRVEAVPVAAQHAFRRVVVDQDMMPRTVIPARPASVPGQPSQPPASGGTEPTSGNSQAG